MGCFDSTCAMTRLPIHHGDEIVYVEYRNLWSDKTRCLEASTSNFLQYTYAAHRLPQYEIDEISRSEEYWASRYPDDKDKLNGYIEERLAEKQTKAKNKVVIIHGKYNDYGGIGERWNGEEVYPPDDIRLTNLYFFIHKAVWDAFKGDDDNQTLYNINRAAYNARIELFDGNNPLGAQYSGSEFLEARKKILDVAEQLLPTLFVSDEEYHE